MSKIRGGRGKSLESLEDSTERTHHTFSAENTQTFYYQQHQLTPAPSGGWRPRSYDDGDITPTNEAAVALHEGGGTLPRPRGLVRPRPVAKITAKTRPTTNDGSTFIIPDFEKPPSFCGTYKSLPRDLIDISKYNLEHYNPGNGGHYVKETVPPTSNLIGNESPRCTPKKRPPSPPKRQSSRAGDLPGQAGTDVVIDCSGPVPKASSTTSSGATTTVVTVDLHSTASSPSLSLPAYPSGDELAGTEDDELPLPPPPAPSSPPAGGLREKFEGLSMNSSPPTMSRSWGNVADAAGSSDQHAAATSAVEQELIASLAMQQSRNGSDASFKSSSSTESDSLPFANENAGTIKQRAARPHPTLTTMDYPKTDELDAMLEEEKRQGLSQ
ncbi:hypothetical protein C0J52_21155 [Blattella germanica]|nr:hypothetical protein C0J52_21155 [Blattella germanica]